jgi:large subunit ribosomal protein L16
MLQPKRQKYRKQFRRAATRIRDKGTDLSFGEYGLKAMEDGWLSANQLEASRRAIAFFTRKGGKSWIRVFPDKAITRKAAGTRMGSGKGDIAGYVAVVTPGKIIFEISGIPMASAKDAMERASHKLSIKTLFIAKE